MKEGEELSYEKRGSFNHSNMARQLLRFDGLAYERNATPMDIDGLIEWHNEKRILFEVKRQGVMVLDGERKALQRMIDDFQTAGKESIAIIADHNVFDTKQDVLVRDCFVRELYYSKEKRWRQPKQMMTVQMLVDAFLFAQ